MKSKIFIFFLTCLYNLHLAHSTELTAANIKELSQHAEWQKLLHVDANTGESKITSTVFFLSKEGRLHSEMELQATLKAFEQPWDAKTQRHAVCQFPARYVWLSQYVNLPMAEAALTHCTVLNAWVSEHDAVSLVLVSGYLGNPASTFGHSLLKLSSAQKNKTNDLFDSAVNYGALVPEDESTLRYIYKGIFGGYKASFSDKYYYTQDLVYSRLESRDMWEYELNLTIAQRQLLIYHVWEVLGQKFDYFFLNENCAYQLSGLLELVIDEPVLDDSYAWYLPVEAFHRLQSIDAQRAALGKNLVVGKIRFLPSSQRKLNYQISQLPSLEKVVLTELMGNSDVDLAALLQPFDQEAKSRILDASLAYYNYRLLKEGLEPLEETKALKQALLLARFKLPARQNTVAKVPDLPSPVSSNKPMTLGLGLGYHSIEGVYPRLRWVGYNQNTTGKNTLEGDELVLLDTAIGVAGNQHDVFLENIDFIRLRKLNKSDMAVRDSAWSWEMRTGIELNKKGVSDVAAYDGLFSFGVGKAWGIGDKMTIYAMTDMAIHSRDSFIRLRPHIAYYADTEALKLLWRIGVENFNEPQRFEMIWDGELEYQLSKQTALFFKYEEGKIRKASTELRWFW